VYIYIYINIILYTSDNNIIYKCILYVSIIRFGIRAERSCRYWKPATAIRYFFRNRIYIRSGKENEKSALTRIFAFNNNVLPRCNFICTKSTVLRPSSSLPKSFRFIIYALRVRAWFLNTSRFSPLAYTKETWYLSGSVSLTLSLSIFFSSPKSIVFDSILSLPLSTSLPLYTNRCIYIKI